GVNWVLRNLVKNPRRDARMIGSPNEAVFARGDITVGRNAKITGPAWVENGATLGDGVQIKPGTVLKENSQLLSGTSVEAGVVFERAVIGHNCSVKSTIIGESAVVGNDVTIDREIIGQGCNIGETVRILSGSKRWPNTRHQAGRTVD